jgi:hypothetical protein
MRIPVPERFTARQTLTFATGLLVVQLAEGTEIVFALLTFLFICILSVSYNVAGGIFYPSGAWILFTGLLTAMVGILFKALLGEAGHTHLMEPNTTMAVYCAGLAGMGVAGWLSKRLRPKRGLLASFSVGKQLKQSAIGCLVFGVAVQYFTVRSQDTIGSTSSALTQLNHFVQLAIILGAVYQIQHTNGRSSTNWIVWAAGAFSFSVGLVNFSKEGMFTPVVTWLIVPVILGFNFSKKQIVGLALGAVFMVYVLVPFSQVGRRSRDPEGDIFKNVEPAIGYLTDLGGTRQTYLESPDIANIDAVPHFYDRGEGLFDRLEMLAFDDALIQVTDQGSVFGLGPAYSTFLNAIPRFLWRDKPVFGAGNAYGHEIGVIAEDDEGTGISFSPSADAYHEAKWFGVIVVEPIIMFILFIVSDSLSGDVRLSPWGLLFVALFAHWAPEGELGGPIWLATFGAEGVIFAAVFSGMVLPFFTKLFVKPPKQLQGRPGFVMAPSPRRVREAAEAGGAPATP